MAISDDQLKQWYEDAATGFNNQNATQRLTDFNQKLLDSNVSQDQVKGIVGADAYSDFKQQAKDVYGYDWQTLGTAEIQGAGPQGNLYGETTYPEQQTPGGVMSTPEAHPSANDSWSNWSGQVGSGSVSEEMGYFNFLQDTIGKGMLPEQVDQQMGWDIGTTKNYMDSNPVPAGVDRGIQPELTSAPVQDYDAYVAAQNQAAGMPAKIAPDAIKTTAEGLQHSVNTGVMTQDEAYERLAQVTIDQGVDPSIVDQQMGWDAGTTQAYIDKRGSAATQAPDTDEIPMDEQTNVGVVNTQAAGEVARGTYVNDVTEIVNWLETMGNYTEAKSPMLSDVLVDIIDEDSDYMKVLQKNAIAKMGAGNRLSSMAAGAVARAAIEGALPIAQGDVTAAAWNAEQYNQRMDARYKQLGSMGLEAQRGSLQFLNNQQLAMNELIAGDIDKYHEKYMEGLKTANLQSRENVKYSNEAWNSFQTYAANVQNSDLTPIAKDEKIREAMKITISRINSLSDVAAGKKFSLEDFGLEGLYGGDGSGKTGDGTNYTNVTYTPEEIKYYDDATLDTANYFFGKVQDEYKLYEPEKLRLQSLPRGTITPEEQKQLDYYRDLSFLSNTATGDNQNRLKNLDAIPNAMKLYESVGYNMESIGQIADQLYADINGITREEAQAAREAEERESQQSMGV